VVRPQLIDEFLPKVEWIERSNGKLRPDVAHDKLVALGFTGSERTTRRAVAAVKKNYRPGRARVLGPWTNQFAARAGVVTGVAALSAKSLVQCWPSQYLC